MRFQLDENVAPTIALGLRAQGIAVTTTSAAGLEQASDTRQLSFALQEERVLLTHDRDFLRLHQAGQPHAGIVFCRQGTRSIGEVIQHLILMHPCLTADEMRQRVEFL